MRSSVLGALFAFVLIALSALSPARADAELDAALAHLHAGEIFEALEGLLPLANAGNARAQAEVAAIYHYGLVSGKNFPKALDYYTRAASQQNVDGMLGLAVMNALGQGYAKNMIEAYKWLLLAQERLPPGIERDRVGGALESFREEMTSGEVETAESRARTWNPDDRATGSD
jgi:TPR repeat protein